MRIKLKQVITFLKKLFTLKHKPAKLKEQSNYVVKAKKKKRRVNMRSRRV